MGQASLGVRTTADCEGAVDSVSATPASVAHTSPLLVVRRDPYNAETPEYALSEQVTPTALVYVRSNFGMPLLDASHMIAVGGAVRTSCVLGVAALRALPQRIVGCTMECAGNDRLSIHPLPSGEPWSSGALSTITWSGPSLRDVLARAGVLEHACEILVTAADSGPRDDAEGRVTFARAIPIADALHEDTILALTMNGAPLTPEHGAPARLVVPGWYGMANVKWVQRIDALVTPYDGYFQRQRYVYDDASGISAVRRMRVKSVITSPAGGSTNPSSLVVRGWAWSGAGAIRGVEVAIDGGEQWQSAHLGTPATPYAWTPWECAVMIEQRGRHALRSRATDATGAVQPDAIVWNRLGYGNNAVRPVVFEIGNGDEGLGIT